MLRKILPQIVQLNVLKDAPPNINNANIENNVVIDVNNDLQKTWLILKSIISMKSILFFSFASFSLILSNTTIVSFIEYPNIVKIAAINGVSISKPNKHTIPIVINTSCNNAIIAATAYISSNLIVM